MVNIMIDELKQLPLMQQRMEICERKGTGHPDTICDSVMNQISIALSKTYMDKFGFIMHHNVDKSLLAAGETVTKFGGGEMIKPMLMVFGDRATFEVGGVEIPVNEITINTTKKWFRDNMRFVDPEEHLNYQIELKRGSQALMDIFERKGKFLGANDTSAAVGFAPMSDTEKIVFETERFLNSKDFKKSFPESGEDIKIMGLRQEKNLKITVAMAFVDQFIDSEEDYFRKKDEVSEEIKQFINSKINMDKIDLTINALDMRSRGVDGIYLTVLGTSADGADCGQVGRGNRVNGIIPLNRPTSSEAAAGKNPVSHVGKIYNILSYRIANNIYQKVSGLKEVYVWLLSQIGKPINEPMITSVQVILEPRLSLGVVSKDIEEVINSELENLNKFVNDLAYGRIPVC
ncbi:MAG: methionine adenosyltransferase [Candidatus Jordarchaeum sp.]|uniref:methionine adenosyltransferase n=1 Tax=Candidatus Jordarchaeum sp. TaxID=2823881 RepID=UPI00404B3BFD